MRSDDRARGIAVKEAAVKEALEAHVGRRHGRLRILSSGHTPVWLARSRGSAVIFKAPAEGVPALEAWACTRLRALGVPAPEVIAVANRTDTFPRGYLITKKLPGAPLREAGLSDERQRSVVRRAGGMLRKIHSAQIEGFGYPDTAHFNETGRVRGRQSSWKSAIEAMIEKQLSYLKGRDILDTAAIDSIRQPFKRCESVLAARAQGSLLHGDFLARHILISRPTKRITGILDPAGMVIGDPVYDLAIFTLLSDEHIADLLDGYVLEESEKVDFELRLLLYRLLREVKELSWAAMAGGQAQRGVERVRSAVARINER